MLPHAAHARQVVLELRELDLQLSLGARRVLGEDVEDQLRAVDHARVERVLEEPLLRRDRARRRRSALSAPASREALLQLLELALADVGALRRAGAMLARRSPTGSTPAVRASSSTSASSSSGVCALSQYREDEPALGLRGTWNHRPRLCPLQPPDHASRAADARARRHRLANRRREAALRQYVTANVPLETAFSTTARSVLYAKREPGSRSSCSRATPTPFRPRGTCPGRIEDGWVAGLGATDMKGGLAVMIELAHWAAEAELAYDLALLFFPREELGPAENPLPRVFEHTGLVDEAQLVICLEPTDNTLQLGCLGNLNARVVFEGRSRALGAAVARRQRDRARARRACRRAARASRATSRSTGLVFREVVSVTQIQGGIASNVIPARVGGDVNFRYAPDRSPEPRRSARMRGARRPRGRDRSELAGRARRAATRRSSRRCARPATSRCSRSRRGRTSRTSPRAASTRSTSGRARRATRTQSTSGSRSPSSSGPTRRCSASSPVASDRGRPLSPVLAELAQYPFARLDDWKADAAHAGSS